MAYVNPIVCFMDGKLFSFWFGYPVNILINNSTNIYSPSSHIYHIFIYLLDTLVNLRYLLFFAGVRNDNEASASTLKMENSENSSAYVNDKFFHSYLSLDSVATTTTMLPSTLSNVWQQSRKLQKSIEKRSTLEKSSRECEPFTIGNSITKTFYSPGYPGSYSKNISCVKIIEGKSSENAVFHYFIFTFINFFKAEPGHIIRLDFRDYFHIEQNDECKFDFLEVSKHLL